MLQRDIANELGVSQTTVSLVLNNPKTKRISPEKREKIIKFLRDKKYFLRSRRGNTGNVGLVMTTYTSGNYDDFVGRFIHGVETTAAEAGYTVTISKRFDELDISRMKMDGLIVQTLIPCETLNELAGAIPLVLLNRSFDHAKFDTVCPDNYGGVSLGIEHLVQKGHRRIGYFDIEPPSGIWGSNPFERYHAFYAACTKHGVEVREEYIARPAIPVASMEATEEVIHATMRRWSQLAEPPTAVMNCGDEYALLMIRQANILGIQVPEELSIIGMDNLRAGKLSWPAITSVDHNVDEMGRLSFDVLLKRIQNPERPPHKTICCARLDIGESVADISAG